MHEAFGATFERSSDDIARTENIGLRLSLVIVRPGAQISGRMKNSIDTVWHRVVDRIDVGDVAHRAGDVKALQIREVGTLSMQRHDIPAGRSQLFDEIETDKTCRARNECKHG
jgi:hypothetical protein